MPRESAAEHRCQHEHAGFEPAALPRFPEHERDGCARRVAVPPDVGEGDAAEALPAQFLHRGFQHTRVRLVQRKEMNVREPEAGALHCRLDDFGNETVEPALHRVAFHVHLVRMREGVVEAHRVAERLCSTAHGHGDEICVLTVQAREERACTQKSVIVGGVVT